MRLRNGGECVEYTPEGAVGRGRSLGTISVGGRCCGRLGLDHDDRDDDPEAERYAQKHEPAAQKGFHDCGRVVVVDVPWQVSHEHVQAAECHRESGGEEQCDGWQAGFGGCFFQGTRHGCPPCVVLRLVDVSCSRILYRCSVVKCMIE